MIPEILEDLHRLVGRWVRVPTKSNPNRHWWGLVTEQRGKFVRVTGNGNAGKPWWTHTDKITHRGTSPTTK